MYRISATAALGAVVFLGLFKCLAPTPAQAHGFAGDRFFPATLLTDDPFVADEMSLPSAIFNPPGPDHSKEIDLETDISKRLWPNVGITISDQWQHLQPKGAPAATGLGTLNTE